MKSFLKFLLLISFVAFMLDLVHMLYHLSDQPALWNVDGVPFKLAMKAVFFLIPVTLLTFQKKWTRLLLFLFFLLPSSSYWVYASSGCENAKELMGKSGIARDASENWAGKIKVQPPTSSFPSDMDKITWWGEFKPFEFWHSPEFKAVWIDPEGRPAAEQTFRGKKCSLAKTTVYAKQQPRGEFKDGIWSVLVTCDDYLIDKQNFAVLPVGGPPSRNPQDQTQSPKDEGVMIWAGDAVKD
jgi:hypothetical protein